MIEMAEYIAVQVMNAKDAGGTLAGQNKYKAYFGSVYAKMLYGKYQEPVDVILNTSGYSDCIITA